MTSQYFINRSPWLYIGCRQIGILCRRTWSTLFYAALLYVIVYSCLAMYDSRNATKLLSADTLAIESRSGGQRRSSDPVTKLLFLSYCRAGSSISSEIFDIDDRAIFYYEPLDAFYFAKTGCFGRKDQKVLMLHNETDFRPIQPWEYPDIAEFFTRLFSCRFLDLPSEFLAHRFIKHTSSLAAYYQCYQHHSPDSITEDLDQCRKELQHVCGKSVHRSLENGCLAVMKALHNAKALTTSQRVQYIQEFLDEAGLDRSRIRSIIRPLLAYRTCLDRLEETIGRCLYQAEQACHSKSLRAIKVVRTSMRVVRSVMTSIPNLYVIVFIRDPRAMAYSRAGSHKEDRHILNNLRLICKKLRLDFTMSLEINNIYPDAVFIVKYEDYVEAPYYWTTRMYQHIGYTSPRQLDQFIRTHMFSGIDDGKKWGNIRPNATELAYTWRRMVSPELMSKMRDQCGDVITMLGYPL